MFTCCVKFCGGCNPRYDRGEAFSQIRKALADTVRFSYPEEGQAYDALLILRGCTGCPYLYEEIKAAHRLTVHSLEESFQIPVRLLSLAAEQQDS